jgi:hypothetical protein
MPTLNIPSVKELKARMAAAEKEQESFKSVVDKNYYPFWKMPVGTEVRVRLLPDINADNEKSFYIPKCTHKLTIDGKDKSILCPKTFGKAEECPICSRSQHYYNVENDKQRGKVYWRSTSGMGRVMVLDGNIDSLVDEEENIIDYTGRTCTTQLGYQVIEAVDNEVKSQDDDEPTPWMLDDGYDFIIKKVQNGEHATYSFSKFAKKASGIPEEYMDNVELIDFGTLLPERPTLDQLQHFLDAHDGAVDYNPSGKSDDDDDDKPSTQSKPKAESKKDTPQDKAKSAAPNKAELPAAKTGGTKKSEKELLADIMNRNT